MITISIITVTYNAENVLEGTIQSVVQQTYPYIEYLIIDGGSTDNTLNIIAQYAERVQYAISEKDKGLYDAMNKGLRAATGDFVWFMNAGDQLYAPNTVEQIVALITDTTDIIYGEVMLVAPLMRQALGTRSQLTAHRLPHPLTVESMRYGMTVSHQGLVVRRRVAPFYIEQNLCADIDWVIKCLKCSQKNIATSFIIANFETGGLSRKRHWTSLRHRFEVLASHYGFFSTVLAHVWIIGRALYLRFTRAVY